MFKYEMHAHTSETSRCARVTGAEHARYYKSLGFDGLCITDHFLNGNTTVDRSLPWDEKIRRYCIGYYNALEEGKKIGLDVFFGWEFSSRGNDFLTYNLPPEWLYAHPEIMEMSLFEYLDFARAEGGYIIHAHPFREDLYIQCIRLLPRKVDAMEIMNASMPDPINRLAEIYAEHSGFAPSAGSDAHNINLPRLCYLELPERASSINDITEAINSRAAKLTVTLRD